MSVGLKGNSDGSGAIQIGGSDAITITTGLVSTLTQSVIKSGTTSPPTVQNSGGTEIGTFCRAWVNFNGTLTTPITPRANFNVGSITKNATGDYTLNFTNSLPDANYTQQFGNGSSSTNLTSAGVALMTSGVNGAPLTKTSSAVRIGTGSSAAASLADNSEITVAIFR